jgi:hypothetical protein
MTKTIISYGLAFSKENVCCKEDSDIIDSNHTNGIYNYSTDEIVVNLTSLDFKYNKTETEHIELFSNIILHETLHSVFHKITSQYANHKEEEIIDSLVFK